MALTSNPIVLTAQDQSYDFPCRIQAIAWSGATTAGDECVVLKRVTNDTAWRAKTAATNTYLTTPDIHDGIPCPNGFKVTTMTASTFVVVYISEA